MRVSLSHVPRRIVINDRALVMRDGRIVGEVEGSAENPITQERIMALATLTEDSKAA